MYLDEAAAVIRRHIPEGSLPDGDVHELLRLYAVLLRTKGTAVTRSDVHDAWAAWKAAREPDHESLVPYAQLAEEVREQDRVFAAAIRTAAEEVELAEQSQCQFAEVLFPSGPPTIGGPPQPLFDLYKIMVESSENLVSRRQGVNTFFLTINGALLTASGIILQSSDSMRLASGGIAVLALAGFILSLAWRSLITSFGQLNAGKFKVINTIERYLPAAIYAAEWEALGRGQDPDVYKPFTSGEIWVPNALLVLHFIAAITAILMAVGCIPTAWIS